MLSTGKRERVALAAGERIGKYRVVAVLGHGGMGTVYLAEDEDLDRQVAVKVVNSDLEGAEHALERFAQEARAIARLDNPHIVRVHEYHADEENPYLVMEYVPGDALAEICHQRAPLLPGEALEYTRQILSGLAAAHERGIIHRDLKPANVLVSEAGVLKLTDFGLARSLETREKLTVSGMVVGTLHYLAPEVAAGEAATPQSDLYSVGITLYEMISGDVPFKDASPLKLISRIAHEPPPPVETACPNLPAPVRTWLAGLLARDPAARYATAAAALAALPLAAGESSPVLPAAPDDPTGQTAAPAGRGPVRPGAPSVAGAEKLRPAEVDAVLERAVALEREGRELTSDDSVLLIAREAGLDSAAVRAALSQYRASRRQRVRRRRVGVGIGLAAVAGLLVALGIWWGGRPDAPRRRAYTTPGEAGSLSADERRPAEAAPAPRGAGLGGLPADALQIGKGWQTTPLSLAGSEQVLLLQVVSGGSVAARSRTHPPVAVAPRLYASLGRGPVELAATGEEAVVRAAVVERLRLAALPFGGAREETELGDLAAAVGDVVTTRLAQLECFQVVERVQVDKVIANLDLENTEHFDPATAGRIGRLLGADYVITGAVQKAGGQVRLSAKRLDAETGAALEAVVVDGDRGKLFALQDRLADALAARIIGTEMERFLPGAAAPPADPEPRNAPADRSTADGEGG
jgi:TolB-like protein/predicted Ser/Thr protein kinase